MFEMSLAICIGILGAVLGTVILETLVEGFKEFINKEKGETK